MSVLPYLHGPAQIAPATIPQSPTGDACQSRNLYRVTIRRFAKFYGTANIPSYRVDSVPVLADSTEQAIELVAKQYRSATIVSVTEES